MNNSRAFFLPALNAKEARTQATIIRNAATLVQDGYTLAPVPHGWDTLYHVQSPRGETYVVDAPSRCTCPGYAFHKDCRHRLGLAFHLGITSPADVVVEEAALLRVVADGTAQGPQPRKPRAKKAAMATV